MARIMAFDYGLKRTGIAVTDPLQIIATGLPTVETSKLETFLKPYLAQEQVEAFVIGDPKNLDGSATHATGPVARFADQLRKWFPAIPIHFVDERFTSKLALQTLVAGGVKKKDRQNKANIDRVSATIILQLYLESRPE